MSMAFTQNDVKPTEVIPMCPYSQSGLVDVHSFQGGGMMLDQYGSRQLMQVTQSVLAGKAVGVSHHLQRTSNSPKPGQCTAEDDSVGSGGASEFQKRHEL